MNRARLFECAQCGDPECALNNGGICFGCFYDNAHPDVHLFDSDVASEAAEYLADHA